MNAVLQFGRKSSKLREWLLLGAAIIAAGMVIAMQLLTAHARIDAAERGQLVRLGHIVSDAVEARFVAIYKTLGAVRDRAGGLKKSRDPAASAHDLQVLGDALLGVRTLIMLDRHGLVLSSNRPELVGQDFSQRPYFITARAGNNPETVYLSAPFRTLLGAYAMQMTRVVVDEHGRFAGIVAATLDPNYFRSLLGTLRYAEDVWVAVAHGGGVQFMMEPDRPDMAGANLAVSGSFFSRHIESGSPASMLTGITHATGEDRLMAIRTIKPESLQLDQKLVVAISRNASAMFAGWRKDVYEYLVGYLLGIAVSVASLHFYQRRRAEFWREQQQQTVELATSERRFRDVVEVSADWIWEIDAQHRYTFVSASVQNLLGYTPDEVLGLTPFDLMPPEEAARIAGVFAAIESDRLPFRDLENTNLCKDGSLRHVLTSGRPIFDDAGSFVGYRGLDRDTTDQKQAEESHLREEALKQAILDSVPANIVVLDRRGVIVDTNQAWQTFGQSNGSPIVSWEGINYLDSTRRALDGQCDDAEQAIEGIGNVLSGKLPQFTMEYPCHSPDTQRWFAMTVTPLVRSEGGVVIAHTDITRRRNDEDRMRTLSAAIEQSPNCVIITDPQTRISYVNQAFCAITGYSRIEVIGQYAKMLGSADTPPETHRSLAGALSAKRSWMGEFHNRRRDGRIGIDACHIAPVRDDEGKVIYFVSVQEDVTEQRRMSNELAAHREHLEHLVADRTAELRATESRLKLLINSTADGILELSPEGIIRMANAAAAEMLGYLPEELLGRNVHDAVHYQRLDGSPYPADECVVLDAVRRGRRLRVESDTLWRSDGSPVPVTVATHPVWRDNRIFGAVMSFFDITERAQADQAREDAREAAEALAKANLALAQQALMNSELYNNAPCGYHSLDPNGRIINANDTELAMLGYARNEYVGHLLREFMTEDSQALLKERFAGFVATGRVRDLEYEMIRKDGTSLPVLISADMVRNDLGEFTHNRATMVDNSERKARTEQIALMQNQLAERAEAAERLARVKSEFLANMSHEIRTPLNGILGLAQIGYRDSPGRGKAQETFVRILSSGKLLLTVINDILDLSKIEAGKLSIESIPLNPANILDEAIESISQQASTKGLELVMEKGDDPPATCLGDPVRISQILLNLLSNAVKFTAAGTIRAGLHRAGDDLVFRVTDTGIGIDPANIGRLFMPFEQADSSTTRKFGGTGLGLAISRRLADMMGGSLRATSTVGVGTTFELRLFIREASPGAEKCPVNRIGGTKRLAGIRVLVAEDNEINRMVLEDILSGEGAAVEMVEDGRQAVDMVRQRSGDFDVVLSDVQMPEMDGIEATVQIRKLDSSLPVIGQTAHALKEEHDRCLRAGMVATITKPIDIETLVATVLDHVRTPDNNPTEPPPVLDVTPQPTTIQVIDWAALADRYPSRPEFIDHLVTMAIRSHEKDVEHLRELIIAGDISKIGRVAHTLKGLAGNLHALQLTRVALRVMHAVKSGSPSGLEYAGELADALGLVIDALKQGRPGMLPGSTS